MITDRRKENAMPKRDEVRWSSMTWEKLIDTWHMLEAMRSSHADEAWEEVEKRVRASRAYSPTPTFYGPAWLAKNFLKLISHQWSDVK